MQIYNTQTHKKEEFVPVEPGKVSMYVCGPTVYDQIHIGNARTFLSFDVIRRYLSYRGYQVTFVQNLTDVDDKIIKRAQENDCSTEELSSEFAAAFITQMRRLGVLDPDIRPRATREIPTMIAMIEELIEKGHAYAVDSGDVYFSVRSYEAYGEVSGRKIDDLLVGARIEANDQKKDPLDFTLWKAAKPGEPAWESPWGMGRPGWHSECAAMVHRYLGVPIDIHGGGSDLVFPHHENEAAQASCCWEKSLANIWMHGGMLLVDGEKMSKSLGNFYTLREVLDSYPADAVRLLMLQTHYRSPLDFSFERLDGCVGTLTRLCGTIENLQWAAQNDAQSSASLSDLDRDFASHIAGAREEFVRQMDDDFNTAGALAAIFNLVTAANAYLNSGEKPAVSICLRACDTLVELLSTLGIESVRLDQKEQDLPHEIIDLAVSYAGYAGNSADDAAVALLEARQRARAEKKWEVADAIRDGIAKLGLAVEDTAAGARLRKKA